MSRLQNDKAVAYGIEAKVARIKELERCLKATLKDLNIINEKYPLISWSIQAQSGELVEAALVDAKSRITRALRKEKR